MRTIIVDDEPLLLIEFKKMLEKYPNIEVVGAYTDPLMALYEIDETCPETAFLDIEMRGLNGIELANRLLNKISQLNVFFVTAYNHYATEAFEANAVDYILKPVREERLEKALCKLENKNVLLPVAVELADSQTLRIRSFSKFEVYVGNKAVKWSRAKQRELFAYLLHHEGKWIDKYRICDDLWDDRQPDQALANLQTAIWAVRKLFKDYGLTSIKIDYSGDCYILRVSDVIWDLRQFDEAVQKFHSTHKVEYSIEALNLYRDGYLYNDDWIWAILDREAYARMYNSIARHKFE